MRVFRFATRASYIVEYTSLQQKTLQGSHQPAPQKPRVCRDDQQQTGFNGVINNDNLKECYGIQGSDRPHRFTFSGIWNIPGYGGALITYKLQ
jgi:hypothetical protein